MSANNQPTSLALRIMSCSTSCQRTPWTLKLKMVQREAEHHHGIKKKSLKITTYRETVSGLEKIRAKNDWKVEEFGEEAQP